MGFFNNIIEKKIAKKIAKSMFDSSHTIITLPHPREDRNIFIIDYNYKNLLKKASNDDCDESLKNGIDLVSKAGLWGSSIISLDGHDLILIFEPCDKEFKKYYAVFRAHELGHIMYDHLNAACKNDNVINNEDFEIEADKFAEEFTGIKITKDVVIDFSIKIAKIQAELTNSIVDIPKATKNVTKYINKNFKRRFV